MNQMSSRRVLVILIAILIALIFCIGLIVLILASGPERAADTEQFSVSLSATQQDIVSNLKSQGFIRSLPMYYFAKSIEGDEGSIAPGGYMISKSMNVFELVYALSKPPTMRWVVIPEGLRKEEIAALFVKDLDWTTAEAHEFINVDTTSNPDYIEGVYFPDTYLISIDQTPLQVAKRLQSHFNDEFAPYLKEAHEQNIKWTTALTLASLVQREAAGQADMPLIAGILWNRLETGMKLGIDATVQYARGNTGQGWWAPITPADEKIDSPYNTYLYKGLPPHPISNPGIDAISAALNPASTTCLYYIHDSNKEIHCSATYDGQLRNIQQYLK